MSSLPFDEAVAASAKDRRDLSAFVRREADAEAAEIAFLVEGLHCGGCVQRIERRLAEMPGVMQGRVNLTARKLNVSFREADTDPEAIMASVASLGFRAVPYDPAALPDRQAAEKSLLRAMAVAGFAAANVMLLSVAVWAGHTQGMSEATRTLMHWISALIAVPAVAYAGRPFYRSALAALRGGGMNMGVPISLAVLLATGMSLAETARGAEHAYFDSAVTLLFFLLVGRFLDQRARGKARSAAERLLALASRAVTVLDVDGRARSVSVDRVERGMTVLVAAGERVPVDGVVTDGVSDLDTALITGESAPQSTQYGTKVFAGTVNLTAPLQVRVDAVGEGTLLAEIGRLMDAAEQRRARYVELASRIVRLYAPAVHVLALAAFLGWWLAGGLPWQESLLIAVAVLIVTCPCALALAVPVVQVVAGDRLMRRGILIKSATALERLAQIDMVVFDKTGTLTDGRPELVPGGPHSAEDLEAAARLARASKHPVARALARAADRNTAPMGAGAALDGPRGGKADDLKMIKGIGPKLEILCNKLGFYHFDQIAAWTADEVAWVDENLEGFKGRVTRDQWVEQARTLAAGGETEFSKRVEDGDVY